MTSSRRSASERGAGALSERAEFIHQSDWLNLYLYPEEVDYVRGTPLGPTWHRLGIVRQTLRREGRASRHVARGTAPSSICLSAASDRPTWIS